MTDKPSLLFIFGVGYSAHSLAQRLLARGWGVTGTVRTPEKAVRLADAGIAAEVWPGQGQLTVPEGAHWLITVPPDADGCPAARAVSPEDAASAGSITYLSTTGVYGDLNGGWAFEWSPVHPQAQRAVARVKAEQQWQALSGGAHGLCVCPESMGRAGLRLTVCAPAGRAESSNRDRCSRGCMWMISAPGLRLWRSCLMHGAYFICVMIARPRRRM